MNGPQPPRPTSTPTLAPVERQWPDFVSSLFAEPAITSLIQGAGEGISSIVNRPDVQSIGGSIISVITAGGITEGGNQAQQTQAPETSPTPQPSSTPAATPSETPSKRSKTNVAAIVGGVVGGVVGLALLTALLVLCVWCRRRRRSK